MSVVGWIAVLVAIVLVAVLVGFCASWLLWRYRRTGSTGLVQRSRLTCRKCGGVFDLDWVPGAALTAVRLGSSRYLACPLRHKWSVFGIEANLLLAAPPA